MAFKARDHDPHAAKVALAFACLAAFGCAKSTKGPELGTDELTQMCLHTSACSFTTYPGMGGSMTSCVENTLAAQIEILGSMSYSEIYDCSIAAGSDCNEIYKCHNEGHGVEPCDAAAFVDRCDGDVVVQCVGGNVSYFDCNRIYLLPDPECIVDPEEGVICADPCTEEYAVCRGSVLEQCDTSEAEGTFIYDCSLWGYRCETVDGWAACMGDPCETDRCEGDVAVWCGDGGEGRIDCAELFGSDYTCVMDLPGGDATCGPRGTQCDPEDFEDTCEGTSLVFCRAGYSERADCRSYGYSSCVTGEIAAHCQ